MLLLLPLFRSRAFKGYCARLIATPKLLLEYVSDGLGTSSEAERARVATRKGKYSNLPLDQCAICADKAMVNVVLRSGSTDYAITTSSVELVTEETTHEEIDPPKYPLTTPYTASCGHLYCYFCLSEVLLHAMDDGEEGWSCLRCLETVRSCDRAHALCPDESVHTSDGWASDEGGLTSFESDLSMDSESEFIDS